MKKATLAILEEAGFRRIELDKTLPPLQLVARGNGYELADPQFCQCAYHGNEKQYAQRWNPAGLDLQKWPR